MIVKVSDLENQLNSNNTTMLAAKEKVDGLNQELSELKQAN